MIAASRSFHASHFGDDASPATEPAKCIQLDWKQRMHCTGMHCIALHCVGPQCNPVRPVGRVRVGLCAADCVRQTVCRRLCAAAGLLQSVARAHLRATTAERGYLRHGVSLTARRLPRTGCSCGSIGLAADCLWRSTGGSALAPGRLLCEVALGLGANGRVIYGRRQREAPPRKATEKRQGWRPAAELTPVRCSGAPLGTCRGTGAALEALLCAAFVQLCGCQLAAEAKKKKREKSREISAQKQAHIH